MVLIDLGFGLYAPNLFPQQAGPDYESTPYLDLLQPFRQEFTIISGTSHPNVDGGHLASKSFLTAAPKPTGASFKNTISLDQLAAEQIGLETRFSSLTLTLLPGAAGCRIPAAEWKYRLRVDLLNCSFVCFCREVSKRNACRFNV